MTNEIFMISQLIFGVVVCVYFIMQIIESRKGNTEVKINTHKESDRLLRMNRISLNIPAYESMRPKKFEDIKGQERGIKALKAALFGENPQHIIIYGLPLSFRLREDHIL